MPVITPNKPDVKENIRIGIDKNVLMEIEQYMQYAGFKKRDHFFEEAALFIFKKDKDFLNWKANSQQTVVEST